MHCVSSIAPNLIRKKLHNCHRFQLSIDSPTQLEVLCNGAYSMQLPCMFTVAKIHVTCM